MAFSRLEGQGQAWMFHNGRVIRATWHKDGLTGPLSLDFKGETLTIPAGHTWIELVPAKDGQVSFK